MVRFAGRRACACVALVLGCSAPAHANGASQALRAQGSNYIYNLDRDRAIAAFRQAIAADPQDAGAYRGLATGLWLSITFRRGNMTVDDYLGGVTRSNVPSASPPAEIAAEFGRAIDRAIDLARQRIERNPKDTDAHYELGAAIGLRASYAATVDGSILSAFRAARVAYDEHEKVLELDPRRKDAGLIVGTYRYIVSALSLPVRWMAYVVGFGGGKERGLRLVEEASVYPGDNQEDARFALILLYNREKRYDDALGQLAILRQRYPRNRLAWLETGATYLRADRPSEADRILSEGIERLATDTRQRMFGEDALWYYKRGTARAALGRVADARADLRKSLAVEGRKWVYGRAHLEFGKLALKEGRRADARTELQSAIALCTSDNDAATAAEARRLLNSAR
jgi:tetratricopeptide (TPR) repeat protein